jgi:hypothetical protein
MRLIFNRAICRVLWLWQMHRNQQQPNRRSCIWYWELTLLARASTSYASTLSFVVSRFDAPDMRCAVQHYSRRSGSHKTLSGISVIRAISAQKCFFVPSDCQSRSKNFTWCGAINSWSVQPRRNHLLLWNRSWIPTIRLAASAFQQIHSSSRHAALSRPRIPTADHAATCSSVRATTQTTAADALHKTVATNR